MHGHSLLYSECIRLIIPCFPPPPFLPSCWWYLHAVLLDKRQTLADATGTIGDSGCVKGPGGLECLPQVRSGAFCSFVCSLQRRCGMQTS